MKKYKIYKDEDERIVTFQLGGSVCGVTLTHGHMDIKATNTEFEQN